MPPNTTHTASGDPKQTTLGTVTSNTGTDADTTPSETTSTDQRPEDADQSTSPIKRLRDETYINPDDYPQQDLDRVLSVTVSGEWGHFRRVDGNSVAVTYGLPPRTTAVGLLSAILGLQRNSYYDVFSPENSRVAIEPVTPPRRLSLPELIMKTDDEGIETNPSRGKLKVRVPKPEADRQRRNYEVLVDPAYRIDIAVSTEPVYNALRDAFEQQKAYYTPSLGKSEFIASIDYHGEYTVEPVETRVVETRTAAPIETGDVIPDADARPRTEKVPMHMEQTDGQIHTARRTTEFGHVTYSANGEPLKIPTDNVDAYTVGDRTVTFL